MSMRLRISTAVLAVGALGACGTIHKPFAVDGKDGRSLALDARQRAIVSVERRDDGGKGTARVICAEPSPDALVSIAASGGLDADIAGRGKAGARAALTESAMAMGRRTQTIQLLRDGLYRACEAYANGAISRDEYARILSRIDDLAVTLVAIDGLTAGPETRSDAKNEATAAADGGTTATSTPGTTSFTPTGTNAEAITRIVEKYLDFQKEMAEVEASLRLRALDALLARCTQLGTPIADCGKLAAPTTK
jgi:hypothetical protein